MDKRNFILIESIKRKESSQYESLYNLVLCLIKTADSELLLLNLHWFYSDWAVCEEDPV